MACALYQGESLDCRDSVGGIKKVFIAALADKNTLTETSGTITAFTMLTGKKFWTFELEKENADFTEKETASVENGTLYYEQNLTFTIKKMTASHRNNIRVIAQNRLMVIVQDSNDNYWLMGAYEGADKVGTNEAKTGKAKGDMNGYTLSFLAKEAFPAQAVTSSLLTTLTVPA